MRNRAWFGACCAIVLASLGAGAQEGEEVPAPAPAPVAQETSLSDVLATVEALRAEMREMRGEFGNQLQEVVGRYQSENERLQFKVKQLEREKEFLRQDLEVENDLLRRHIRELYGTRGIQLPAVPTPDKKLIESVLAEEPGEFALSDPPLPPVEDAPEAVPPATEPEPGGAGPDAEPEPMPEPAPAAIAGPPYEVVEEWGRSPEEAANLGAEVSSLKGMIVLVPEGADDAHVARVARELRHQFEAYDNINIEIFDDRAVALRYQTDHVAAPEHRVASISKHAASDRDVVLLIRGETATELPLEEPPAE